MKWPLIDMEEMIEKGLIKLGRGDVISKLDIAACPGPYPIYSSAQMNNGKFGEYGKYMFDQELITWSVDGGGQLFYRPKHKFSVTNVAGILVILDSSQLDCKYFHYVLSDKHSRLSFDWIRKAHPSVIRRLYKKIPLPPLDDQIRIAHLLGKVEGLIAQRKQHLQQLDTLIKSVFLEMFGDPVRNEKGWDTKTLPQLVLPGKNSLKRGPFGGTLKKEIFVENGYLVYEQNHALNNDYSFGRYFVTEEKYKELIDFKVVPGDILISCSGVYLGKLSIVPDGVKPGIINQALLKVSVDPKKVMHVFFVYVFGSPQFKNKYFPSNRGGAIPNLPPMATMKEISFISPPIELQQDFTKIFGKVEVLKSQYQGSLLDLEALYGALSQQAFKGELDLTRVPIDQ